MEINTEERNEAKENFLNKKYRNDEKNENGPYANNLRSSSEAVGMEKLIPSLRQRQQIDITSNPWETRNDSFNISTYVRKNCEKNSSEVFRQVEKISKSSDEEDNCAKTSKKKSKMKSTFNTVFRSLRSRADKLLTNFLSSGNYNRLIIATSAATAAVKRSSITDTEEEEENEKSSGSPFQCGPHLTVSLGCNNGKNKSGYNKLETDDMESDSEFYHKVRRSRTLDFKTYNGSQLPVRSNSTNAVKSIAQETPSKNPFDDCFVSGREIEYISNQENVRVRLSDSSSHSKQDNSTQFPPNSILLNSSSQSLTSSHELTYPDITNLVSPRPSISSTPGLTGSEFDQEGYNDQLSDESWDDEDLTCNVCDRAFVTPWHLERHQQKKRHWGCNVCDTLFNTSMSLEYHKEEFGHWTSDEDDDYDEDEEIEIEDYASDEETAKYDDHNNNKKKKLRNDTLNDSSIDHSGFYQTNSKTNNANSCFQLQNMSKDISDYHSSSTHRHIPKTQSMAFDFEWDDNEERKIRNRPCGGEKVLLL